MMDGNNVRVRVFTNCLPQSLNGIEIIQIIAIGKRDKLAVYRDAEKRI